MRADAIAALVLGLAAGTASADTHEYTVLFQGKPGGAQTTVVHADGRMSVDFSYRTNGRGPDVKEEIALDRDGTQLRHRLVGKATFGSPIDELYERAGTQAQWRSLADTGEARLATPAAYVPIGEASVETFALLARAMLRTGRPLATLPAGQLTLERLHAMTLRKGTRRAEVVLYAINGLDYQPVYVWLTAGREARLFAWIYPAWVQLVERGWEAQADTLERAQVEAQSRQLEALVPKLAHRVPQPIVIRNARVFDAEHARLGAPSDVYVHDGRITAVYPAGWPAHEAGTVIDAAGRVLLPGLFDMHDHATPWRGLLQIAGGVTTVRDMANDNAVLAADSARVEAGRAVGPRVVPAGFIEGQSEFAARNGFVVGGIEDARRAIDWYAQRGFPQIKIYNSYRREWVEETARYAHERGLRVSGHVPAFMRAEEVVRMGYDELQHINQVMLNFLVGPADDTRTLARFYLVMEKAHALDLGDRRTKRFLELLRKRGTVVDPTAATFEDMYQRHGQPHPAYAAVIDHLPATVRRALHQTSFDVNAGNETRYRASYDKMLEMIGRMHRAGIPLVAGTDTTAGLGLHRELELYAKAGIPAPEVLRIATWNGAKYTRTLDRLGSVTPGKLADLVLVDGDPTTRISDIRRISLVIKAGVLYHPAEVYPAVGVKPFVDRIPYVTP